MTTYSYYPGCSLHASAKEYDVSARLVCQAIGVKLEELEDWVCCGAASAHSMNRTLGLELPRLTLESAGKKGLPLAVACSMCFSRLKVAAHEIAGEAAHQAVGSLKETAVLLPETHHLLQILADRKNTLEIKRPLSGLKVACYYGCMLVRPHDILQFDDEENPTIMDRLISHIGAETLDWGFKTVCCGADLAFPRPDIVLQMSHRILSQAKETGADCLAVACPLCHSNLDTRQKQIQVRYADNVGMPVFYFTQLVGLALGLSPKALLLAKHFTNPMPLLTARGLF